MVVGGAKQEGDRLFPTSSGTNDQNMNYRVDKGYTDPESDKVQLVLQANSNAKDPEVKKAAQKDSHDVLGTVTVDPENPDEDKARTELLESFLERRDHQGSTSAPKAESKEPKDDRSKSPQKGSQKPR